MLKTIRYALAAICLAASVGCLALWWHGYTHEGQRLDATSNTFGLRALDGLGFIAIAKPLTLATVGEPWHLRVKPSTHIRWRISGTAYKPRNAPFLYYPASATQQGWFGLDENAIYFPLWYPAIVFALAAVAALRIGRQFTLRSALMGMSVVAAILGMAAL